MRAFIQGADEIAMPGGIVVLSREDCDGGVDFYRGGYRGFRELGYRIIDIIQAQYTSAGQLFLMGIKP